MGFFVLACIKDKFKNRLNAMYAVRLAMSNVKPRFRNFVEAKKTSCGTVFSFLFHFRLSLLSLVGSQLFFQRTFLTSLGRARTGSRNVELG